MVEIERYLSDFLAKGWIRPSISPWSHGVADTWGWGMATVTIMSALRHVHGHQANAKRNILRSLAEHH
jgi:hypothetical protein